MSERRASPKRRIPWAGFGVVLGIGLILCAVGYLERDGATFWYFGLAVVALAVVMVTGVRARALAIVPIVAALALVPTLTRPSGHDITTLPADALVSIDDGAVGSGRFVHRDANLVIDHGWVGDGEPMPLVASALDTSEPVWDGAVGGAIVGFTEHTLVVATAPDMSAVIRVAAPAELVGLEVSTGEEIWRVAGVEPLAGQPTFAQTTPYFRPREVQVLATRAWDGNPPNGRADTTEIRDPDSGEVLYELATRGEDPRAHALVFEDLVVLAEENGFGPSAINTDLTAYDAAGEVVWERSGLEDSYVRIRGSVANSGSGNYPQAMGYLPAHPGPAEGSTFGLIDLRTGERIGLDPRANIEPLFEPGGQDHEGLSSDGRPMTAWIPNGVTDSLELTGMFLADGEVYYHQVDIEGVQDRVFPAWLPQRGTVAWLETRVGFFSWTWCALRELDPSTGEVTETAAVADCDDVRVVDVDGDVHLQEID